MCKRLNDVGAVIFSVPRGLRVAAADVVLGLLDEAQDVDDALEIALAGLGQRQLTRGALEQPGAEPLLEQADALGDDGRRQAHLAARRRHVAGAGDACENVEIADRCHVRVLAGGPDALMQDLSPSRDYAVP